MASTRIIFIFIAPPPLGTIAPPDKETVKSFSFRVELAKASNEKGIVRYE